MCCTNMGCSSLMRKIQQCGNHGQNLSLSLNLNFQTSFMKIILSHTKDQATLYTGDDYPHPIQCPQLR